jgi:hypothetical protein
MHLFEYLILLQLCLFSMQQQESILLSYSINYKYPNVINTFFKRIDSSYICYYITLYLYFAAQHRAALMILPVLIDNPGPRGAGGRQVAIGKRGRGWQGGRGGGRGHCHSMNRWWRIGWATATTISRCGFSLVLKFVVLWRFADFLLS